MIKYSRSSTATLSALVLSLILAGNSYALDEGGALDCTIEPSKTAQVGSIDEGILEDILVARGDVVSKGQVLAEVESQTEKLTTELARIRAEQDVDIRSRKARHAFQEIQTERAETLLAKDMVSDQEVDDARIAESLALLEVEAAVVSHAAAQLELALAEARLERRSIKSPINGIVTEVKMSPGEYITEQSPLLVLADIEELNVEVFVSVSRYGEISLGQAAVVEPVQPIGGSYKAVVEVVDRVFDAASGTFGVRLLLDNPDRSLPAGIRCKVRFLDEPATAAEAAPETESASAAES